MVFSDKQLEFEDKYTILLINLLLFKYKYIQFQYSSKLFDRQRTKHNNVKHILIQILFSLPNSIGFSLSIFIVLYFFKYRKEITIRCHSLVKILFTENNINEGP